MNRNKVRKLQAEAEAAAKEYRRLQNARAVHWGSVSKEEVDAARRRAAEAEAALINEWAK